MKSNTLGPVERNPSLNKSTLTLLLVLMAVVPTAVTLGFRFLLDRPSEKQLHARFVVQNLPGKEYYQKPANKRAPLLEAMFVIKNLSKDQWSYLNIEINHKFEIRDMVGTVEPGEVCSYRLDKFYDKRSGNQFHPELSPVTHVRVFAKVGQTRRETLDRAISWDDYGKEIQNNPTDLPSKEAEAKTSAASGNH